MLFKCITARIINDLPGAKQKIIYYQVRYCELTWILPTLLHGLSASSIFMINPNILSQLHCMQPRYNEWLGGGEGGGSHDRIITENAS